MTDFSEDLIWDTIKDHAKDRIDYSRFAALFSFDPDNFLSSIIYGFAVGRSASVIADKIAAQVSMTGNSVDRPVLQQLVETSEAALGQEIDLTRSALRMLDEGSEPEVIYTMILDSFKSA